MTQKKTKREAPPPHRSRNDAERRKILGATLRSLRQRRNLSLNQVVYDLLDLNGASPLIEIEKGKRLPTLSTLRKIGKALRLSPAEMAELEGLAGYRSETRMPPRDQIETLLKQLEPELARYPYPAYVIDYLFRFWIVNAATAILVGGYENLNRIINFSPTVFDVLFDSRLGVNSAFFRYIR